MYAEEVWVAATFRKAVQRFRHPSKAERRKVTIPELVILFTIKIVMCVRLVLIIWLILNPRSGPHGLAASDPVLGKTWANSARTAGWRQGFAPSCNDISKLAISVQSFGVLAFPCLSSLFLAGFHDANRLKRHWRCINLWDWNTLMNLDALCISLYPIIFILLPGNVAQSRSSQELFGRVNHPWQLSMWNQSRPGCDPRRGAEWWTLSWFMANTDECVYTYYVRILYIIRINKI